MTAPAPAAKMNPLKNKKVLIAGGVVGGVVVFIAYRRAKSSASQTVAAGDAASDDLYAQSGGDYGAAGYENAGGSPWGALSGLTYNPNTGKYEDPNASSNTGDYESITVTDNQSWVKKGLAYLQSLGYDTGAGAQALGKYVTGAELSPQDENLISTVMGGIGGTPVQVPPSTTNQTQTFAQWARAHVFNPDASVQYQQDTSTGAVYQVWGSGQRIWLDPRTWQTLQATHGASIGSQYKGSGQLDSDIDLFDETTAANPVVVDYSSSYGGWTNVPAAN